MNEHRFTSEAVDEISAAGCDFQTAVQEEAVRIAKAAGRDLVTREDVEAARIKIWPA